MILDTMCICADDGKTCKPDKQACIVNQRLTCGTAAYSLVCLAPYITGYATHYTLYCLLRRIPFLSIPFVMQSINPLTICGEPGCIR